MEEIKKDGERTWYLVKEWTTKAGNKARIHKCEWSPLIQKTAPSLHNFYCGYVQVPADAKIDEEKIGVHGGITFSKGKLLEENGEWVGFDMAHLGDENVQDLDYAVAECEKLAAQVNL